MEHSLSLWFGFLGFIAAMLAVDLGIFNRRPHAVSYREALSWSIVWVLMAFGFFGWLHHTMGEDQAVEFITGYLIEKSLSADNLFVFVLIFGYFNVPVEYKHRVLFWGIIGALMLRGALIIAGTALISHFHWVAYLFGLFLMYTGVKLLRVEDQDISPERNHAIRIFRKFYPITDKFHGTRFFVREGGKWMATPLFLVILMVGTTDFVFALDSIPAIFAITLDPFIVFTANVFAVLGLRSLYFLLANLVSKFHYLKFGLCVILVYVGFKMIAVDFMYIPTILSLGVIGGALACSILASLVRDKHLQNNKN